MLTYSKEQKRRTAAFILAFALAVSTTLPPFRFLHSPAAFVYIGLILAWGMTIQRRILQPRIRRLLLCCCGVMIAIFVLRICRYDLFQDAAFVREYTLYLYGVCYTLAALLSFLAARNVGKGGEGSSGRLSALLWAAEALLCALMLTNPLHHLFYTYKTEPDPLAIDRHGPVYFLMLAWCAAFALAAIALLLARCRNSVSRKYWYLPAGGFAIGVALLSWYFAVGGAPQIGSIKLFNLQEAFCLTVILPFEAIFRIGLIPTNNDYDLFFRETGIKAAIEDESGEVVLRSAFYSPSPREGERARSAAIPGGRVVWYEDISELLRLQEELTALNEDLAAENELIRAEKELRAERIAYETRNRLYDSISEALRPQAEAMRELLADFPDRLKDVLVRGAFLKRMGNLMLLADGRKALPAGELALCLSESMEYLQLCGIACALDCRGEADIPADAALRCYRVFERLIEANAASMHACAAQLLPAEDVLMRLSLDAPSLLGAEGLQTSFEDDTWAVTLRKEARA